MIQSELHSRVTAQVRMLAAGLALDPATLEVRHDLDLGGADRTSFSIADANARYHLELAGDEAGHAALRRWHDLGGLLATRYGAPRICGWLEIVDTPFAGLLREHVAGRVVDLAQEPDVNRALGELIGRLHLDRGLAARLPEPLPSCRDAYLDHHFARLTSRLRAVRAALPEFVDPTTLSWLAAEVDRITAQVRKSKAFAAPADLAIHGDLGPGRVLVGVGGELRLLGWDALRLGDPALDLARLPPLLIDPRADTMTATRATREPWLSERVLLLRRAHALAAAIDPLGDWLAAEAWPEHRGRVQGQRQRAHEQALAAYRRVHA